MPKNAADNPLVLPILGLLVEQPLHPYAVFSELRRRYEYLHVRSATVYTLLHRLATKGWTTPVSTQSGVTISPTEAGIAELADRVRHQVRQADISSGPTFVTALAYVGVLPASEAEAALTDRAARVRAEIDRLKAATEGSGQPEIHMIEAHYLISRLAHDVEWLDHTARRIATKAIDWPQ